jgi:AcrR family transcriptional regulator
MVHVLLTARRFVIVHEEVETFIHDYLDVSSSKESAPIRSRAQLLFALALVGILASSHDSLEAQDAECLNATLLAALRIDPSRVSTFVPIEPAPRDFVVAPNDLRARLAYHTFSAVGRSGYDRATISRISRRAKCSPGAIYKLFPSKEDLIIASIGSLSEAPWISLANFSVILDPETLAQFLYSAASNVNDVRKDFAVEVALASAQNDKLRVAVNAQMRRLEFVIPLIEGLSEEEIVNFTGMTRIVIFLVLGVAFLSTVTKTSDEIDFNQLAEPLRLAMLDNLVPAWEDIRRQLESISGQIRPRATV